ncbi:hypothetical protein [Archaeoglobus sulfaticallidus]|uniref:hypothetical protein n=1 Tax=Archaeoglobus sulfaticallidus TaxID=1316941 RepID=UPI00064E686F|nr:hypothetical protein [Archaeoglobus sulfaticallidus]
MDEICLPLLKAAQILISISNNHCIDPIFSLYFFITFLAMRVYFSILKRLREEDLTSRISVNEVLFEFSKVMLC